MFFPGGPPEGIPVRWYFTDKEPDGVYSRYASKNWDQEGDDSIGEIRSAPRQWVNGRAPDLTCSGPCGSKDAWAGKLAPWACRHPAWVDVLAEGEVEVAGDDRGREPAVEVAGESDIDIGFTFVGEGAVEVAGEGNAVFGQVVAGEGAVEIAGEGNATFGQVVTAEGAVEIAGEGNATFGQVVTAEGAVEIAGEADIAVGEEEELSTLASGGRLTLSASNPLPGETFAAGTLYFLPFASGYVLLPNTAVDNLERKEFTSVSLAFSLNADTNYDVYLWNDGGTLKLHRGDAWPSDISGGDAKFTLKGVEVNNAAIGTLPAKRGLWVGTVRGSASNQVEDSAQKRFLWNRYNAEVRPLSREEATIHTYNSATFRRWNNALLTRVAWISGKTGGHIHLFVVAHVVGTSTNEARVNFDLDGSLTIACFCNALSREQNTSSVGTGQCWQPALGYHFCDVIESMSGTQTGTFNRCKIFGHIMA